MGCGMLGLLAVGAGAAEHPPSQQLRVLVERPLLNSIEKIPAPPAATQAEPLQPAAPAEVRRQLGDDIRDQMLPTRWDAAPLIHGGGSYRRMTEASDAMDHLHMGPLNEQLQHYLHTDVDQWVAGKAPRVVGNRRSLQSSGTSLEEDGPWEPIRIHVNTSIMYDDPTGRACYEVGARMNFGTPATDQASCELSAGAPSGATWDSRVGECICGVGNSTFPRKRCYDICTEPMILTPDAIAFVDNIIIGEAVEFLRQRILVNPVVGGLRLGGGVNYNGYPADTRPGGVPSADFYLTVVASPQDASLATGTRPANSHATMVPQTQHVEYFYVIVLDIAHL